MIQAVILAGGLGTRMRPFTETLPKPMLPILGRPFLEHQLELLRANQIQRFVLLVGYLGHIIEDYFRGEKGAAYELHYAYEASPLGTGGALKNAAELLEEDFLLVNGDTLLDIDYAALVEQFRRQKAGATIAAYRNRKQAVASNLRLDGDGTVIEYRKGQATGDYVDAGVLAVRKEVLGLIPKGEVCSLERQVFPQLIKEGQLSAWRTDTPFFDMGTPEGLRELEQHLAR